MDWVRIRDSFGIVVKIRVRVSIIVKIRVSIIVRIRINIIVRIRVSIIVRIRVRDPRWIASGAHCLKWTCEY